MAPGLVEEWVFAWSACGVGGFIGVLPFSLLSNIQQTIFFKK